MISHHAWNPLINSRWAKVQSCGIAPVKEINRSLETPTSHRIFSQSFQVSNLSFWEAIIRQQKFFFRTKCFGFISSSYQCHKSRSSIAYQSIQRRGLSDPTNSIQNRHWNDDPASTVSEFDWTFKQATANQYDRHVLLQPKEICVWGLELDQFCTPMQLWISDWRDVRHETREFDRICGNAMPPLREDRNQTPSAKRRARTSAPMETRRKYSCGVYRKITRYHQNPRQRNRQVAKGAWWQKQSTLKRTSPIQLRGSPLLSSRGVRVPFLLSLVPFHFFFLCFCCFLFLAIFPYAASFIMSVVLRHVSP